MSLLQIAGYILLTIGGVLAVDRIRKTELMRFYGRLAAKAEAGFMRGRLAGIGSSIGARLWLDGQQ